MSQVKQNAGTIFTARASRFVLDYLGAHGASSGEVITDACKAAGIRAHDDRAMGPVFMSLSRAGLIEKAGFCVRNKGHATGGGNIWRLK